VFPNLAAAEFEAPMAWVSRVLPMVKVTTSLRSLSAVSPLVA
jgi:hypothetical protein